MLETAYSLFMSFAFFILLKNAISDFRTKKIDERPHQFLLGFIVAIYFFSKMVKQLIIFSFISPLLAVFISRQLALAEGDKNALNVLLLGYMLFPLKFVTFICFLVLAHASLIALVTFRIIPENKYPFYPFILVSHLFNGIFWLMV